jgi:hypothetical protein
MSWDATAGITCRSTALFIGSLSNTRALSGSVKLRTSCRFAAFYESKRSLLYCPGGRRSPPLSGSAAAGIVGAAAGIAAAAVEYAGKGEDDDPPGVVGAAVKAVAAAAAAPAVVAEQEQKDDDPPPVVAEISVAHIVFLLETDFEYGFHRSQYSTLREEIW